MLIFRYLAKEVFLTLVALTSILLLIFMSNQVVLYLNRAANGSIPGILIMKLMALELPNLLGLLLPLGFYVALLLAYGRLYADSEMTVLQACGYRPQHLLKHSIMMAFVVMVLTTVMVFMSPLISRERVHLLRTSGVKTLIQTIMPGRFRAFGDGQQILYVESMSRDRSTAHNIFIARSVKQEGQSAWDVIWASRAWLHTDKHGEDYVTFQHGQKYQGQPGQAHYQVARFDRYQARLPHPTFNENHDIRSLGFLELLPINNKDKQKAAELQWRLSIPLMVLTLTCLAVPLSRVNPRSGKYAKLLPAIVLYIIYANFLFVARNWVAAGKIPPWLGLWWLHGIFLAVGVYLFRRQQS